MKKLMIAAAIVCAAAVSQAATCSWMSDYAWGDFGGKETYSDESSVGTYWLVALGDTSIGNYAVDTTGALVYKGEDGTYSGASSLQTGSYDAYGLLNDLGGLSQTDNGTALALIIYDTAVNAWGISGAETITGITDVPPANAQAITFYNYDDTDYGWKEMVANQALVSNVPEPTSGLLLLLGVAGLALRRRRA